MKIKVKFKPIDKLEYKYFKPYKYFSGNSFVSNMLILADKKVLVCVTKCEDTHTVCVFELYTGFMWNINPKMLTKKSRRKLYKFIEKNKGIL